MIPFSAPLRGRNLKLVILAVALAMVRDDAAGRHERHSIPRVNQEGDAVTTFAGNAQHTAVFNPAAQDLTRIRWSVPIDLNNTGALAHYGAPLITVANTVLTPVKIAGDLFQVRAFDGTTGAALTTDYILPPYDWIPMYQPVLAAEPGGPRLYYPGAGGTVYFVDGPDSNTPGAPVQRVFYTTLADYQANAAAFNTAVFINTPITADSGGNIFFGFRMVGTAPPPLSTTQGGFDRIAPDGTATYVLAGTAANDPVISRDSHNSAHALSNDQKTSYVAVKSAASDAYGYLLGLDTATLTRKYRVFLKDPGNTDNAIIIDASTSSPTVAPDDDVYFGVLGGSSSPSQDFLLRFSCDLTVEKAPGAFGWDNTAAIVPREMVPSYTGTSSYLVFSKYNNYATDGGGSENSVNRIAIFDPGSTEVNPRDTSSCVPVMREVLTMVGPTPDAEHSSIPTAVREWCINTAAVNPATHSIFTPSEDGHLYRWDLATNSLSQAVRLTAGIGENYVPTVIGPDGTVYTLNGGTLFALGGVNGARIALSPSVPGDRAVVASRPLTFMAAIENAGSGSTPTGTVIFEDTADFVAGPDDLQSTTTVLCAGVALNASGHASCANAALSAGTHFIAALYSGDGSFSAGRMVLVQRIHDHASSTTLASTPNPSVPSQAVTFTATVTSVPPGSGTPTGMVTFQEGTDALAQVPLDGGGMASFSTPALSPRSHAITAIYSSDSHFPSSARSLTQVVQNAGPAPVIGLQPIASSLGSITSITNAGDSRLFLTIQTGKVLIFNGGSVLPSPFLDVTPFISCCGERGLLSVAFHPQYASNGFLFVYATNLTGDIEIARYRRSASDANAADPSSRTVVLTIPHPPNTNRNGGQLQFGPEGYLFIGTGYGGSANDPPCNAQDDDSRLGKMLRIDVDQNVNTPPFYAVPSSNPMARQVFPRNLTWAKGLRVPFRFSFDRAFGDLWIGDVGQGAWEEVDFQPYSSIGGENYGWKIMEGNHCGAGGTANCPINPAPPSCGSPLFQYPVYEYAHGSGDCSIIGGYVYRGSRDSSLLGSYVYGDLCTGRLWIAGQLQASTAPGLQTFGQGADGELYAATGAGSLFLVTHPNPPAITSLAAGPATAQPFGMPITWTVAATGGVAPLQYRFWRYNYETGVWTMVQDYGASNTFTWTPAASDAGTYTLAVWVRNAGSISAYDVWSDVTFTILNSPSPGAPLPPGFSETNLASGLSNPTAMAFAPDGRLFVCEQAGKLRVIKNNVLLSAPFLSLTVDSSGERGLLGVAFDPLFTTNGFVYVYYTATTPTTHNRVSRFVANGDVSTGAETILLDLDDLSAATNHNGGGMHFGLDGKLYVGVGENANGSNAQTLGNLLGKLLRINSDGSIPADNPFYGSASGKNRAIWALGLRNPFTFAFQRGASRIFINDVGESTWEEINDGMAGANYGWPITEGPTTDPRFVSPIFAYGHGVGATVGCAIVGAAFYDPPAVQFPASYLGNYFFADLCSGWIRRLDPSAGNAVSDFATGIPTPVDLAVSTDGSLYYLARGGGGIVNRIRFIENPPSSKSDFSGDGEADIVWRNPSTGRNAIWAMSGVTLASVVDLPILPNANYRIAGVGDFNSDGKPDLLLRNDVTGQNALWLMNGTTIASILDLPALPNPAYRIGGVGDFSGDGSPDILWRNVSTGRNAVWLMNGTVFTSVVDLPGLANADYQMQGSADLNGDGKADIVWRNAATGQNAVWLMNGTSLLSIMDLPVLPNTAYRIGGIADYNADGSPDLVWRNSSTGLDAFWLLNGTTLGSIVDLPGLANPAYEIAGPR